MKIKKIEYENFRNFKDHGVIEFSTDGKVTIIYGENGDGKTTLHQLFQWVFYGTTSFNKTTTDILYNLLYESQINYGSVFKVVGKIDFEDKDTQYTIKRTRTYKKGLNGSDMLGEEVDLLKEDDDHNWMPIDNPSAKIEQLLPSGLADYFFFDGESMIADLRVKENESAKSLRKMIYSVFNLDSYEAAIDHIGATDKKKSVLGQLFLEKGDVQSNTEVNNLKSDIMLLQSKIEHKEGIISGLDAAIAEMNDSVNKISEKIGQNKSKTEYENERKIIQNRRKDYQENIKVGKKEFGTEVMRMFPSLLIGKAIETAEAKIVIKKSRSDFPIGLNKDLLKYLLDDETEYCICGHKMTEEDKEYIRNYYNMMPPNSYDNIYSAFIHKVEMWKDTYDKDKIEDKMGYILKNDGLVTQCDQEIDALDSDEKNSKNIEDLIVERKHLEDKIRITIDKLSDEKNTLFVMNKQLKASMKKYEEATEELGETEKANAKIKIMEEVLENFKEKLSHASIEYSKLLEETIQGLLNRMLTSERTVKVSQEFAVRVRDSFNDESKSEGQFAVVSFAYIGGILKMLKHENVIEHQEYPLILDGPFSKLDKKQRLNVCNTIPEFAPQVILFSKDDLKGVFNDEYVGKEWTLVSNKEKNIARVEEGHLWN